MPLCLVGAAVGLATWLGGWRGAVLAGAVCAGLVYGLVRAVTSSLQALGKSVRKLAQTPLTRPEPRLAELQTALGRLPYPLRTITDDLWSVLQNLLEDRARLRSVLAATPDGVIATDREGRITLVNRAAERILSVRREDLRARRIDETVPEEIARLAHQVLLDQEEASAAVQIGEKALELHATPLHERRGVLVLVRDVSEMRRLETMRRDFVTNVSHELKTPLTSIRAYVETLLDGGLDDSKNNVRFLQKIEFHASRLTTLITDLLSLSKVEAGQAFTQLGPVNVVAVLRDSYQQLAAAAEAKGIALELRAEVEPIEVLGDEEALRQIFDNLIDNAIKYSEPEDRVTVTVGGAGDQVLVEVKDTGVGIPPADLNRIFERFYRVDRARSREMGGTGLGLSIVKHYVQALGGNVQVESQVGVGSTFTVSLPLAYVEPR